MALQEREPVATPNPQHEAGDGDPKPDRNPQKQQGEENQQTQFHDRGAVVGQNPAEIVGCDTRLPDGGHRQEQAPQPGGATPGPGSLRGGTGRRRALWRR
jgi:hypothetical protein